ncbi:MULTISPECIES: thioredoxin family protein [Flavobacterium]|uniref:protein-disulfide reductase DsbD family protein n=1 Tax=Flavobacterium TaxID=237 RepID=UPI001182EEFC|nr:MULTISPECIES: thioredoxin family protein [Flavobacterium]MCR4029740.1 thioredoxin family protein [Flavobacterium panacis]
MKKVFYLIAFLLVTISYGQKADAVVWKTIVEKVSDKEYILSAEATISSGAHLYSQNVSGKGTTATTFMFDDSEGGFTLLGNTTEEEGQTIEDPVLKSKVKVFENKTVFTQKIAVSKKVNTINAFVEFVYGNSAAVSELQSIELSFDLNKAVKFQKKAAEVSSVEGNKDKDQKGILGIFIISFLSGFAALLTPCVFPMIPMTVSFFTKQSKNKASGIRNALFYGISIIVIYVALGTLVTTIFGADSLNALATNVTFNLIFFLLLIFFAMSFLGAFEIVLPSSWLTKVDEKSQTSGIIGILFMALALAVVSFSCTGPIVGTLLVQAASQGGLAPIVGMFGFSLAIALPFAIFAAFPGWLNSLPKSGGWLNSVKVVLGFLELALAFKFLSNADLVLQLHLLERETFLAIWIAIFVALALYLFGKITLAHDSPLPHISVGRLGLGIFVLAFIVYLIPGLWGAPLQWISGFPPPKQYSESPYGLGAATSEVKTIAVLPKDAEEGPNGIVTFRDYDAGMAYAKKENKPVMLDFTGFACVNCRKMEERVWPDPRVLNHLNKDVVLISLYVDDKRPLAEEEQIISKITGEKLKYIGQKWSEFQILKYKTNAQPYYVLIDHEGKELNEPTAYNPDIEFYNDWLEKGINNFKSL